MSTTNQTQIEMTEADKAALDLVARGALFVANNSGGKDSQAMMTKLRKLVPAAQILVVHADLSEVEWPGTAEHARQMSQGLKFEIVKARKTFWDMVNGRQNWPSPQYRQCTSDLKRGVIEKAIRAYIKATGHTGLIVNCMGIRAEESSQRAKREILKLNAKNSKAGREWYDWLPIFNWSTNDIVLAITAAGQRVHPAYYMGMSRLSCAFCIMSSRKDLQIAARQLPGLYQQYLAKEQEIGKTLFVHQGSPITLDKYIALPLKEREGRTMQDCLADAEMAADKEAA